MEALNNIIKFAAQQVATADKEFADGIQGKDFLAFMGAGFAAPAIFSTENRKQAKLDWEEARRLGDGEGIETLRKLIRDEVKVSKPSLERKIEKVVIALISAIDAIEEWTNPVVSE